VKFYVPDWDDRVDPGFDFITERHTLGRDPYRDDVYAHELIENHLYDGVLVSRMALGESGKKQEAVNRIGMKNFLRLPPRLELFGDCGAYGYVADKRPRFNTEDVIEYYSRLGFDYGVSVDHLIVPEFKEEAEFRYQLTLRNAREFMRLCRKGRYSFAPVGAVQGWDIDSYVAAAKAVVSMGYGYIALGGLARSNTEFVSNLVKAVRGTIPKEVKIHVFGVGRSLLFPLFVEQDVTSVDSAAPIRQAWLSARNNYHTSSGTYAAIRIPVAGEERAKKWTLVGGSAVSWSRLRRAEERALEAIRRYDNDEVTLETTLTAVSSYDEILADRKTERGTDRRRQLYRRTLTDQPWKKCPCPICKAIGVEVIIFRGNNRNRRRGFHNLWITRSRIDELELANSKRGKRDESQQAVSNVKSVTIATSTSRVEVSGD
jgi:hypothetical protein